MPGCFCHTSGLLSIACIKPDSDKRELGPFSSCLWEEISRLSRGADVPRHFTQHRIHSQRKVSAATGSLGILSVAPRCSFKETSYAIGLKASCRHAEIQRTQWECSSVSHPAKMWLFFLCSFFLFRVLSKMSTKIHSLSCLKTSKCVLSFPVYRFVFNNWYINLIVYEKTFFYLCQITIR